MAKAKALKEAADKKRAEAKAAEKKLKEAEAKKSKDAPKLKETFEKLLKEAEKAENEAKEAAENENENESHESEDDDAAGDSGDEDHDDADQDKALIKKMIGEYLGKDADGMSQEEMEAVHKLAKEALEGHKEMGKKEKEAYQSAGEAIKLAHHMAKKEKAAHESEDGGDDDGHQPPPKKKGDDGDGDDDHDENENECGSKESAKRVRDLEKKLLESEGKIAALEAKTKKAELDGYVDKKLKESNQPESVKKRFLEKAGKIRSERDFDNKWDVFSEGLKSSRSELDWGVLSEKATAGEDGGRAREGKELNFSACAED